MHLSQRATTYDESELTGTVSIHVRINYSGNRWLILVLEWMFLHDSAFMPEGGD